MKCIICQSPIDPDGQYLDIIVHNFGRHKTLRICQNGRCMLLYVESAGFVGRR